MSHGFSARSAVTQRRMRDERDNEVISKEGRGREWEERDG